MFVRTYGSARSRIVRNKGWSLGLATFLFFVLVILLRSNEDKERNYFHPVEPWHNPIPDPPYDPKWMDYGIGDVGDIEEYEIEELYIPTTVPNNQPHPKTFDDDGNEVSLRFLIVGDWGGQSDPPYVNPVQLNLAKALGEFARRYETKFVMSLGDNFCDEGVKNVDDHRFQDTFENVFTAPALYRPWYVIAGNDDYKGNVTAQILYTSKSRRWFFEREYYKLSFQLPSYRNVTVDILMIDTVQLCGRIPPGQYQPIEPDDEEKAEKQWKWIEKNLKRSPASYLLVAGHYPVYSGGHHGSTVCLKRRLKPLLEAYHVSAYFSGHDHSVQHYKGPETKGVNYFITGATHPRDDSPEHLDGVMESSQFFWTSSLDTKVGAFTYCDLSKDLMSVVFVNTDQKVLYFATVLPRANKKVTKPRIVVPASGSDIDNFVIDTSEFAGNANDTEEGSREKMDIDNIFIDSSALASNENTAEGSSRDEMDNSIPV